MGEILQMPMRDDKGDLSAILQSLVDYAKKLEEQNAALVQQNEVIKQNQTGLDKMPDVLVAQDIADYLRVSRYTVYGLLKMSPEYGGIKSFEIRNSVRCMKADFAAWLERQSEEKAHGVRKTARNTEGW